MGNWILKLAIRYIAFYAKHFKGDDYWIDLCSYRTKKLKGAGRTHRTLGIIHYSCKSSEHSLFVKQLLEACGVKENLEITEEFDDDSLIIQKERKT